MFVKKAYLVLLIYQTSSRRQKIILTSFNVFDLYAMHFINFKISFFFKFALTLVFIFLSKNQGEWIQLPQLLYDSYFIGRLIATWSSTVFKGSRSKLQLASKPLIVRPLYGSPGSGKESEVAGFFVFSQLFWYLQPPVGPIF